MYHHDDHYHDHWWQNLTPRSMCVCDVGVRVCAGVWCASEPGGMIPLLDQCVCGVDVCVCAGVRYAAEHAG